MDTAELDFPHMPDMPRRKAYALATAATALATAVLMALATAVDAALAVELAAPPVHRAVIRACSITLPSMGHAG